MSNLGDYQDFSTAAKAAGGVARHLQQIRKAAVAAEAPIIFLKGMGAGVVVLATGATVIGVVAKKVIDNKKAAETRGAEAEAHLTAAVVALEDEATAQQSDVDPELEGPEA